MKWIKASNGEYKVEPINLNLPTGEREVFIRWDGGNQKDVGGKTFITDLYETGWADIEWFDESPESLSPSPSLQEAATTLTLKDLSVGIDELQLLIYHQTDIGFDEFLKPNNVIVARLFTEPSPSKNQFDKALWMIRFFRKHDVRVIIGGDLTLLRKSTPTIWKWYNDQLKDANALAGWNARETQQTGVLLTRELFDSIWEAAVKRTEQGDWTQIEESEPAPDKETFFTSLNL